VGTRLAGSWIGYHARVRPDHLALADLATGQQLSYRELDDRIGRLAGVLGRRYGIIRGDRVAMLSRNCVQAFELMYACGRLGAIFVPLNVRLSDPELAVLAADAAPGLLAGEADLLSRDVAAALPRLDWEGGYAEAVASGEPAAAVPVDADDPWVIIYTSGTTGRPKGVVVTHAGSEATMLAGCVAGEVTPASVCLTALPVWHVAGLNLFANPSLFLGATVLVMQTFDAEAALGLLTRTDEPVTHFCGVPAHYQFMQAVPGFGAAALGNFVAGVGGSPVPAALVEAWGRRGVALRTIYGISEAGSTVTMAPAAAPVRAGAAPGSVAAPRGVTGPGDVGVPMWHLRCRVMAGDRACAPGEPGELQISGASVTPGYWRRPAETAQAIVDGWLHTGDVATIGTDGHVRIVDRIKDMYISGGENVYPAEVEELLYQHPAVSQAAVIGAPDERWGESGVAWLVLRPGMQAGPEEIRGWARTRLAAFKVPRDVRLVDELPRNATGKVLKAELRRRVAADDGRP
jgi:fatty-acyl-CoA synthase